MMKRLVAKMMDECVRGLESIAGQKEGDWGQSST